MVLLGQDLAGPSAYTAADKNKPRKPDSSSCYQAREAKRDPEGEEDRPRRTRRHFDWLTWALFCTQVIPHDSPPDEIHDCKHHDPHRIYEMPIKGNYAKSLALSRVDPTEQSEYQSRA